MHKRMWKVVAAAGALAVLALPASAATLDQVKSKGYVQCGVSQGVIGYSAPNDKGEWAGFDIDFCRALAAAIFNDPSKAKFTPLSTKDRFTALQSGEIDILTRNTTWTLDRDTKLGFNFVGTTYYDGQGFMVKKSMKINSALELSGASVCTQTGTTTELNLADYFRNNKMKYEVVAFATADETIKAYESGRCDVFTTDQSQLYAQRLKFANPDDHMILPEIISKEPLGPSVRQGDSQWFTIVRWVHFALLNAEEAGITKANVDKMLESTNPDVRRILGKEGEFGKGIGLANDWAYQIIKQVGNYGEVFDRNIGKNTPFRMERGLNALWTNGGLIYAPPFN